MSSKTCAQCASQFEWTDKERAILDKISPVVAGQMYQIPDPEECGRCRYLHLLRYKNPIHFFPTTCVQTGKPLLSVYHPASGYKVMDKDEWWGDNWNALDYGRDFDFSRSFFEQFDELKKDVPRIQLNIQQMENSPYTNYAGYLKNCYFVFHSGWSENIHYGYSMTYSRDTVECVVGDNLEQCYHAIDSTDCYQCFYIQDSRNCQESYFLYDCKNCKYCIGCYGLRNKEYYIGNKPVSKEEYERQVAKLRQMSYQESMQYLAGFQKSYEDFPRKDMRGEKNENVTGNYVSNSKNMVRCFECQDCEDCFDCDWVHQGKQCISLHEWGAAAELVHYSVEVGDSPQKFAFCVSCYQGGVETYYSDLCMGCKHIFGCTGLKKKEYCIFNKQYTKEEYEELLPRIIEHMKSTGEWGKFFPRERSPFSYNEATSQLEEPLTKEQIEAKGMLYREMGSAENNIADTLDSDRIQDVDESITKKVLQCEVSGRPYRIIPQEYAFYLKHGLPIPRLCYEERLKKMLAMRAPKVIVERQCGKCGVSIETAYAKESVYCEKCYLETIG